jgi:hypothetical protein
MIIFPFTAPILFLIVHSFPLQQHDPNDKNIAAANTISTMDLSNRTSGEGRVYSTAPTTSTSNTTTTTTVQPTSLPKERQVEYDYFQQISQNQHQRTFGANSIDDQSTGADEDEDQNHGTDDKNPDTGKDDDENNGADGNNSSTDGADENNTPDTGAKETGLPLVFQSLYLIHNDVRRQHNAPPLTWSYTLSQQAQRYADQCTWKHSHTPSVGENLFAITQTPQQESIVKAALAWYQEEAMYDYGKSDYLAGTGHFTQMVWRGSEWMGCGVSVCDGMLDGGETQFVVCQYSPQGNVIGSYRDNVLPT